MIEDQVLFHLTKFGNSIQSLLSFPPRLKGRDEAVPQGSRFASLNPVLTHFTPAAPTPARVAPPRTASVPRPELGRTSATRASSRT